MSNQDDTTRITWQIDAPPNTSVSIEPVTKHDGKLPGGDTYEVSYDGMGKDAFVCIQGTHNLADHEAILEPKQALFLLDWLRQEETTLKKLAKEQAE
jgi:hypothetical protein